jgi:hypothetical protein
LYPFHKYEKLNQITSPEIATVGNSHEKQMIFSKKISIPIVEEHSSTKAS